MDLNFQQGKDLIAQKVKQFAVNRVVYLAPAYKEAHARQELIDPFFEVLGWDVRNTERAAPDYRQVVAGLSCGDIAKGAYGCCHILPGRAGEIRVHALARSAEDRA
jgi:hypothetical protein